MLWTSDAWSTSHSSQQHSEPLLTIEYIFDIYIVESYNFGPNIFWPSDPKIAAKYYVKSSWKWILLQQRSVARDFVHYSNRWAAVRAPQYLLHFQRFRLDDLDLATFISRVYIKTYCHFYT